MLSFYRKFPQHLIYWTAFLCSFQFNNYLLSIHYKPSTSLLLSHFSHVRLCATPQTAAHQAPPSLGFSRQEHWSGLPFPSSMHDRLSQRKFQEISWNKQTILEWLGSLRRWWTYWNYTFWQLQNAHRLVMNCLSEVSHNMHYFYALLGKGMMGEKDDAVRRR